MGIWDDRHMHPQIISYFLKSKYVVCTQNSKNEDDNPSQISTREGLVSSSSTQNSQICVGSRLFRVPIPSLEIVNK